MPAKTPPEDLSAVRESFTNIKFKADRLAHGNDERISINNLQQGTEALLQIVLEVAAEK